LNGGGTGWENVGCSLFQAELLAIAGSLGLNENRRLIK
jgi:hypothetical protein